MEFNKAYNRQDFVYFLQNYFLPDDFIPALASVSFKTKMIYSKQVVKLGSSASLDLVVYEVIHKSKHDARVSLSKEAFRMLADETEDRALVVFIPEDNDDNYRFSLIEIELEAPIDSARITRSYSNPRRYSYLLGKGIAYYTPNKYLNEKGRVVSPEDLRSRFSVEVLTKSFYQELSDWYAWVVKIIRFPNKLNDPTDDDKFNAESTIRLVTRLIFVWFLKQKSLIPNEFFDRDYIKDNLLEDFNPEYNPSLFYNAGESKYYKAILQNLFFAMLNSPITKEGETELSERHFRKNRGDYDNNKLMRYESLFTNPQLFVDLANRTVPFLNGGLFDCLDVKDADNYIDGFSDRKEVQESLFVPDYIFFAKEVIVDLSHWYEDKKKKKVKVSGILNILKRYNFTIEENTPFDQEVSLDPELLGKVFENLLASYNPETQTTARKQTGSFYTPREIVQYMVDESLVAHLKRTVGEELEPQFRQLMQYTDDEVNLTDEQQKQIMQSLYNCKVLDPACGSGAFPMGMLQQMVHILSRIDPGNTQWREMMLDMAVDKTSEVDRTASSEYLEIKADINRSFDKSLNRPDYARKLYLIENCIYGVDIQPIAIQISKLRFFISLVVDQKTNNNPADNFGIRPLPNLEAKFVAANTLIGLNKKDATLFDTDAIRAKKEELKIAKHKIFGAKTVRTKRKYRQIVNDLRIEITNMLKDSGAVGNVGAQQLASWDMFDQNASSSFFDSEWMFDIKNGFDIVIANPPYGYIFKNTNYLQQICDDYQVAEYKIEAYSVFTESGINLLCTEGFLCYITPYTFISGIYFSKFRNYLKHWNLNKIVILGKKIFEAAEVDTSILLLEKSKSKCDIAIADLRKQTLQINIIDYFYVSWDLFFYKSDEILFVVPENDIRLYIHLYEGDFVWIGSLLKFYHGIQTRGNSKALTNIYENGVVPIIKGADFNRYVIPKVTTYIRFVKENIKSGGDVRYYDVYSKLLIRTTADRIIASVDYNHYLALNSVNVAILLKKDISIEFLLGVLNSKLMEYWYRLTVQELNKTFAEVKIVYLERMPIKYDKLLEKQITFHVSKLLSLTDDNIKKKEEQEIDELVYKLYGLSYDEILIVDPQTPITRNEYEK